MKEYLGRKASFIYVLPIALYIYLILVSIAPVEASALASPQQSRDIVSRDAVRRLSEINGRVVNETGTPLADVHVAVKGRRGGARTNADGNFRIGILQASDTLIFSLAGYKRLEQQAVVEGKMEVTLQPDPLGQEEVYIGYRKHRKMFFTGAVSSVDSVWLVNRPVGSLAEALQGTLAGLIVTRSDGQPGMENVRLQMRGVTSVGERLDPLLLIDGVPAPMNRLYSLNTFDVESVTLLKDAGAAGIYAGAAAGGVIQVITKTGKRGRPVLSYSNFFGIDKPLHIPERLSLMEEATYNNLAAANANGPARYSPQELDMIRNNISYYINPADTNRYIYLNQDNWTGSVMRRLSARQQHQLSLQGGVGRFTYLASLGAYARKGVFRVGPDRYDRYNARLNMGLVINRYLSLETRLSFAQMEREKPSAIAGSLFNSLYRTSVRYPIFTPEGRLAPSTSTTPIYGVLTEGGSYERDSKHVDGMVMLKATDFVRGLQLRVIYDMKRDRTNLNNFGRTVEFWNRNSIGDRLNNPSRLELADKSYASNNIQVLGDYHLTIGARHSLDFQGGYQMEEEQHDFQLSSYTGVSSNYPPVQNPEDFLKTQKARRLSTFANAFYFSRVSYNYAERLLVSLGLHSDLRSFRIPEKRKIFFPSLTAGWIISNENWFPQGRWISSVKMRASWGRMGGASFENSVSILEPEVYEEVEPLKRNESIEMINQGIDVVLLGGRLKMAADYYRKYNANTHMFVKVMSGPVAAVRVNYGKIKSWGWELSANYAGKSGEISYYIGGNLGDNQNRVIEYEGERTVWPGRNVLIEGYPLNTMWGFKTNGYIQNDAELQNAPFFGTRTGVGDVKYVDRDGDNSLTNGRGNTEDPGDLIYLGTDQSRYTFGITGGASWKGFDFSVFFQGVGKRTFFASRNLSNPHQAAWVQPLRLHVDYWTPENRNAAFPRPYLEGEQNYLYSDKWILNGRYIRLKHIQLGYSLPSGVLRKIRMAGLRIFVTGQDLFALSRMGALGEILDPEVIQGTNFFYPFSATAALGLNLTL